MITMHARIVGVWYIPYNLELTKNVIYDFLLALNSNLTSIFNRSWDITPNLHILICTSVPGGTGKDGQE